MDAIISVLRHFNPLDLTPGYVREFRDAVRLALRDGKLTEKEIASLEERREELGLSEHVLYAVRQELYMHAFLAANADDVITDDEWQELEQIQDYLGLRDADIAATKKDLYRARIMTEIRKGNLPVIDSSDVLPEKGEIVHWAEPVILYEPAGRTVPGIYPTARLRKLDTALMIVTSKRVILKGRKSVTVMRLRSIVDADCHVNGVLLHAQARRPVFAGYAERGNQNVVGSILLHAIARAKNLL